MQGVAVVLVRPSAVVSMSTSLLWKGELAVVLVCPTAMTSILLSAAPPSSLKLLSWACTRAATPRPHCRRGSVAGVGAFGSSAEEEGRRLDSRLQPLSVAVTDAMGEIASGLPVFQRGRLTPVLQLKGVVSSS